MSISSKLIVLVTSTVLCLVVGLCLAGYFLISESGNQGAKERLAANNRAAQLMIEEKMHSLESLSAQLNLNKQLSDSLAKGDAATLKAMAKTMVGKPGIDQVTIVDAKNVIIARGHSDKTGDSVPSSRLAVNIPMTQGRPVIGLEPGAIIRLALTSGTPIFQDGKIVGVVIVGEDLSSGSFVQRIKDSMTVECTLFLDDTRISTTVMRDGKPFINTKLNNDKIYDQVLKQGNLIMTRNMINGEEYDTAYWPWKDISGKNAGMFFVGLSRKSIEDTQRHIIWYFVGIGVALGLVLIAGGAYVARAISRPIQKATSYAEAVAGGNFSGTLTVESKDEVGVLAGALGRMVENLKSKIAEADSKSKECQLESDRANFALIESKNAMDKVEAGQKALLRTAESVQLVVSRLTSATTQLSTQVLQASKSAEHQREQVSSCSVAMEEMNSTVMEVARNADVASEVSDSTRKKAVAGETVVEQSVEAIGMVQRDTEALKDNIQILGQQAEAIGAIMTVISDIADQTNLLALNAAIEAARAGEAGRGFAVVADEVRKLAEKTMQATGEVGASIKGIQQGTRKNIESVDLATANLSKATDLSGQSGRSLADIVQEANRTADQVRNIAAAAAQQSAASEEISRTLEEINAIAVETANVMVQATSAVSELDEQAHELQDLVNSLKK